MAERRDSGAKELNQALKRARTEVSNAVLRIGDALDVHATTKLSIPGDNRFQDELMDVIAEALGTFGLELCAGDDGKPKRKVKMTGGYKCVFEIEVQKKPAAVIQTSPVVAAAEPGGEPAPAVKPPLFTDEERRAIREAEARLEAKQAAREAERRAQAAAEASKVPDSGKEKEYTSENPLWNKLKTLESFTPEERREVDRLLEECIGDIGNVGVQRKLIYGTLNDYSLFAVHTGAEYISADTIKEMEIVDLHQDSAVRDHGGRQTEAIIRAYIKKGSPLLKLLEKDSPHGELLGTVLRLACIYLDDKEKYPMAGFLDDAELNGKSFPATSNKAKAGQYYRVATDQRAGMRFEFEQYEREWKEYFNQPVSKQDKTTRDKYYGDLIVSPEFIAYKQKLLSKPEAAEASVAPVRVETKLAPSEVDVVLKYLTEAEPTFVFDSQLRAEVAALTAKLDISAVRSIAARARQPQTYYEKNFNLSATEKEQIALVAQISEKVVDNLRKDEQWKEYMRLEEKLNNRGVLISFELPPTWLIDGGVNAAIKETTRKAGDNTLAAIAVPTRIFRLFLLHRLSDSFNRNFNRDLGHKKHTSTKSLGDDLVRLDAFLQTYGFMDKREVAAPAPAPEPASPDIARAGVPKEGAISESREVVDLSVTDRALLEELAKVADIPNWETADFIQLLDADDRIRQYLKTHAVVVSPMLLDFATHHMDDANKIYTALVLHETLRATPKSGEVVAPPDVTPPGLSSDLSTAGGGVSSPLPSDAGTPPPGDDGGRPPETPESAAESEPAKPKNPPPEDLWKATDGTWKEAEIQKDLENKAKSLDVGWKNFQPVDFYNLVSILGNNQELSAPVARQLMKELQVVAHDPEMAPETMNDFFYDFKMRLVEAVAEKVWYESEAIKNGVPHFDHRHLYTAMLLVESHLTEVFEAKRQVTLHGSEAERVSPLATSGGSALPVLDAPTPKPRATPPPPPRPKRSVSGAPIINDNISTPSSLPESSELILKSEPAHNSETLFRPPAQPSKPDLRPVGALNEFKEVGESPQAAEVKPPTPPEKEQQKDPTEARLVELLKGGLSRGEHPLKQLFGAFAEFTNVITLDQAAVKRVLLASGVGAEGIVAKTLASFTEFGKSGDRLTFRGKGETITIPGKGRIVFETSGQLSVRQKGNTVIIDRIDGVKVGKEGVPLNVAVNKLVFRQAFGEKSEVEIVAGPFNIVKEKFLLPSL